MGSASHRLGAAKPCDAGGLCRLKFRPLVSTLQQVTVEKTMKRLDHVLINEWAWAIQRLIGSRPIKPACSLSQYEDSLPVIWPGDSAFIITRILANNYGHESLMMSSLIGCPFATKTNSHNSDFAPRHKGDEHSTLVINSWVFTSY